MSSKLQGHGAGLLVTVCPSAGKGTVVVFKTAAMQQAAPASVTSVAVAQPFEFLFDSIVGVEI